MLLIKLHTPFRIVPAISWNGDGQGLWFCEVKWLGAQVCLYSKQFAHIFVFILNNRTEEQIIDGARDYVKVYGPRNAT